MVEDITTAEANQLNRMNEAANRALLGTVLDQVQADVEILKTTGSSTSAAQITNLSGSANTALTVNNEQSGSISRLSGSATSAATANSEASGSISRLSGSATTALTVNDEQSGSISRLSGSATTLMDHIVHSYTHTVSAGDATGSLVYILTGTSAMNAIAVQYYRSGSLMQNINVISSGSRLTVTPATAGSLVITENDVIYWFVA
jgi:hypothetical protein